MPNILDASPDVQRVFDAYSDDVRPGLLALRSLIFDIAGKIPTTGGVSESLKWGQPSYLSVTPKLGTPVRLGLSKSGRIGLFVHCQTTLVDEFKSLFPDAFEYDGTRGVHLRSTQEIQAEKLSLLISSALTYHKRNSSLSQ
ncbi:MAG: DUF1801 domain-containing protein [Rhodobacteraceae bacterium]|nr:DUF1801 domain-containing protein [Paracoccaceae bacterium]